MTLYLYNTTPSKDGIVGADFTFAQLMTDYYVHRPSTYLASLKTNTTNPGRAYKILFPVGLRIPMTAGQVCQSG